MRLRWIAAASLPLLCALVVPAQTKAPAKTVAITIDDLPFVSGDNSRPLSTTDAQWAAASNRRLLAGFARHHVPVVGLVNESGVEALGSAAGSGILRSWIDSGFDLGNHTFSHPSFNDLTVAQFEDQVVRGEKTFLPLMQAAHRDAKFFRFPFNNTGDTREKHDALAAFLKQRGYRTAPCTIEDEDWLFNAAYFRAKSQHDEASVARIRAAFLAFAAAQIDYFTALNRQVLGYDPPHIMLMHDNPLNADLIDDLLTLFEKRGYRFVTLTQAEKDPAYQAPETEITRFGPMWGYRWARERGVKVNGSLEPQSPPWVAEYAHEQAK